MRVLSKEGISAFQEWILSLAEDPTAELPLYLLEDDLYSYGIPGSPRLEKKVFETKYELAKTLSPVVSLIEGLRISHDSWPGVWSALALFYFESICKKKDGKWDPPRGLGFFIYGYSTGHMPRFYEHRIYGPVTLYRTSPESVRPFFEGRFKDPSVMGQYEQSIGASNELAGNPTILEVLRKLYVRKDGSVSPFTGTETFSGSSKKWDKPGGVRRIPKVCKQLRRTYDLPGVSCASLLELLPQEFHDWLEA